MPELDQALEYHRHGVNVVPASGKTPIGSWKRWSTENQPEHEVRQAFKKGDHNIFAITGAVSGVVVLDCDNRQAVDWWKERLGEDALKTARVRTAHGWHFWWRHEPSEKRDERSHDGKRLGSGPATKWTFRCEGGGVIAPPSIHESGRVYQWAKGSDLDSLQPAPEEVYRGTLGPAADVEGESGGKSMLSHLLAHPPQEEGGRNDWLTKVAGHYAKTFDFRDAYEVHVRQAAELVGGSLTEEEVDKLIESIWSSERAKAPAVEDPEAESWRAKLVQPTEGGGWLASGKERILAQVRRKRDGETQYGLEPWMDADIRVEGVIESERGRSYEVDLLYPDGGTRHDSLPATTVADSRALAIWLANRGCGIAPPDALYPRGIPQTERLRRYLDAQEATEMEGAEALGWHKESKSFITHEGVIRADSRGPHERVRPDAVTRNWAPYRYGNREPKEARRALQEVLGFHFERVTAVFGAWWAACFLKPQIMELTSQFPFMAIEAPSESGKTAGFFALMLSLAGNTGGHTNPTRAALRDYLAAHHNGIVWVDDLDDLSDIEELLRAVTTGEAIVKKGLDHREQAAIYMRGALVVSGENLGLSGQKALMDRAIELDVPSPVGRMSAAGDRPQWDDIVDFRRQHDPPDYAGGLVQLALGQEGCLADFGKYRHGHSRRHADKIGIVRLGARVLEGMVNDSTGWISREVDAWAGAVEDPGVENSLSLLVVPQLMRLVGAPEKPVGPNSDRQQPPTAILCNNDGLWVDLKSAADWWTRTQRAAGAKVRARTESHEALVQQAKALGMGGKTGGGRSPRREFKYLTQDGRAYFWRFPDHIAELIRERVAGGKEEKMEQVELPDGD